MRWAERQVYTYGRGEKEEEMVPALVSDSSPGPTSSGSAVPISFLDLLPVCIPEWIQKCFSFLQPICSRLE